MGKHTARVDDHLILEATVDLPAEANHLLQQRKQPLPTPVSVRLIIDTGAKRTTLIPGIVTHLNPPKGLIVQVATPLATVSTELFWVRFEFPGTNLAAFQHVQVARLPMPPGLAQFHGLLGRDLLRQWDAFLFEGRLGRYTLHDKPGLFRWLRRL